MISLLIEKGMGIGYAKTNELKNVNKIKIDIRGKAEEAKIIKLPFYKK